MGRALASVPVLITRVYGPSASWFCLTFRPNTLLPSAKAGAPLTELPRLTNHLDVGRLAIKQCGTTHTGSFKDLGMTVLVSQVNHMVQSGKHDILGVRLCLDQGYLSRPCGLLFATGLPSVVLIPAGKISPAQLVQPMSNGSLTLALDTDFDGCMRLVQSLQQTVQLYGKLDELTAN